MSAISNIGKINFETYQKSFAVITNALHQHQQQQIHENKQQNELKTKMDLLRRHLTKQDKTPTYYIMRYPHSTQKDKSFDINLIHDGTIDKTIVEKKMIVNLHRYFLTWLERKKLYEEKRIKYEAAKNVSKHVKHDSLSKILALYNEEMFDEYHLIFKHSADTKEGSNKKSMLPELLHVTIGFHTMLHTGHVDCLPIGSIVYFLDDEIFWIHTSADDLSKELYLPQLAIVTSHERNTIDLIKRPENMTRETFIIKVELVQFPGVKHTIHAFGGEKMNQISIQKSF
jgi:hypothetical protein